MAKLKVPKPNPYPKIANSIKYDRAIWLYKTWVDVNDRKNEDGTYLSRDNVDDYYEQIFALQMTNCENEHAYSVHRALQWFSDEIERPTNGEAPLLIRDKNEPNSKICQALWRRE